MMATQARATCKQDTQSLVACFGDRTNIKSARVICSQCLAGSGSRMTTTQLSQVMGILRDKRDNPLARVEAAIVLLNAAPSPELKEEIKQTIFGIYRQGHNQSHIRMSILRPHYVGDKDVLDFLTQQLLAEPNPSRRNGILDHLAHMQIDGLVDIIAKELDPSTSKGLFSSTRMHLALGNIGGEEAFDLLRKRWDVVSDQTEKNLILQSLGATRDHRAKIFLLDFIHTRSKEYYISAIKGLQFFGDPSVIPILEKELAAPTVSAGPTSDDPVRAINTYEASWLRHAIAGLQSGDTKPNW